MTDKKIEKGFDRRFPVLYIRDLAKVGITDRPLMDTGSCPDCNDTPDIESAAIRDGKNRNCKPESKLADPHDMAGSRLGVVYLTAITYISRAVGITFSPTLPSIIWKPLFGQLGNMDDDENWETVPTKKKRDRGDSDKGMYQPPISVEFIPPTAATMQFRPFVLLLCGIPGSGKSTFARALETAMPYKVRSYCRLMLHDADLS